VLNSKKVLKRIGGLALSAVMLFSSVSALAAGEITWQVKDYITTTGFSGTVGDGLGTGQGGPALVPAYEIVYEQYLDGVATGLVISGNQARDYGLKGFASSITRPKSWYDSTFPNLQYEEIYADGEFTGLVWPTGARLPFTSYKDFRYMWEVGGKHKEVSETRAFLNGKWIGGNSYPKQYTGANADVLEENKYFGFDVFEIYEDGKARDVEVVLDKSGNAVNTKAVKANMKNAASANTVNGSITKLVNSGSGVKSVLYEILGKNTPVAYKTDGDAITSNTVPVYDFTGFASNYFDDKLPINHYFHLAGPTYNRDGSIADKFGKVINAYEDCVTSTPEAEGTGSWTYDVNKGRFDCYTDNIIKTHDTAKATTNWVYAGYEQKAPYRMYEYLSIEGIVFDGDIDNDESYDTPVIFRYPTSGTANITNPVGDTNSETGLFDPQKTSYALADPKVEWRFAFVETSYPHELIAEKFVENMEGEMIATGEYKGTEKFAKENVGTFINPSAGVDSVHKHYQIRLEWRDNETRQLVVTPYFDANEHAGEYVEVSTSEDPSYIANPYEFQAPGAPVFLDPEAVKLVNDND